MVKAVRMSPSFYTYDYNGNRLTSTDANNNATQYVYDYNSQLTRFADALNNITGMAYGGTGCPSCTGVQGNSGDITLNSGTPMTPTATRPRLPIP